MKQIDLELKLLAGRPIEVRDIIIRPKNVGEIIDYGYSIYNEHIGILALNVSDLIKGIEDVNSIPEGTTVFDLILSSQNKELIYQFIHAIMYFLDEETFDFDEELGLIFGEERLKVVNHRNYNELVDIIRFQNCVKMPKADSYNPADERARQIIEKLNKGKEAVEKAKSKKSNDNIDFQSIVSAVSTRSNSINKLNIWELTVYQLYDEFKRIEKIQGYETSILAMLNGADIKDLQHWSSKIED